MEFVKTILELFRPDEPAQEKTMKSTARSGVTNQVLYQELIAHFKSDMEELSVGRRVLYPMSFNVLLHPNDYNRVWESLAFILPEVISGFYAAIKEKSKRVENSDATPPAAYWFFQFASSSVKTDDKGDSLIVPGEIVTVGHLTTFDIKKAQFGSVSDNTGLSIKCKNSNVNQNNINPEALLGLDILSNNTFSFNFDKKMNENLNDIQSSKRDAHNALATLTYSADSVNVRLDMMDDLVILSGPGETRSMENIMIVKNDAVAVGHVQIRYLKDSNKFQLCAYSKTRLNMREVPVSVGGSVIWKDLPYKSDIFLNDEVNVQFRASETIRVRGIQ